jgi:hypothetical protein
MTQRHMTVLISFRTTKIKQLASFLYFLLLTVAPFPIAEQDATPTGCCAKPLASPQALSVSSPSQPSSSMAASLPYSLISPQGTAQSRSLEPRVGRASRSWSRHPLSEHAALRSSLRPAPPRRRGSKTVRLLKSPPRAGVQCEQVLVLEIANIVHELRDFTRTVWTIIC